MTSRDRFAAAITCIDGRFQTRTLDHLQTRFGVGHVDNVTAAGAVKHLVGPIGPMGEAILANLAVSIEKHGSQQVAIVAHADCAGNPVPDPRQQEQLREARQNIKARFPRTEVVALFLDPKTGFKRLP